MSEVNVITLPSFSALAQSLKVKGFLGQDRCRIGQSPTSAVQAIHQSIRQVEMQCNHPGRGLRLRCGRAAPGVIEPENQGM